eukprot:6132527-Amphidinium_carterae.1
MRLPTKPGAHFNVLPCALSDLWQAQKDKSKTPCNCMKGRLSRAGEFPCKGTSTLQRQGSSKNCSRDESKARALLAMQL